jgi:hypothetical protein
MSAHPQAMRIWREFCGRLGVSKNAVLLFDQDDQGQVRLKDIGAPGSERRVLARSGPMEGLVKSEVGKLTEDYANVRGRYDGLIYIMGRRTTDDFEPLYIGKTETLGRDGRNLSANILGLDAPSSKFARWGYNYAYHLGDLSACVVPGHAPDKRTLKYQSWAEELFEVAPTDQPTLRAPIWFWATAWDSSRVGVWQELGATRLAFLEYLLIGVAGLVSPRLLNREGLARGYHRGTMQ